MSGGVIPLSVPHLGGNEARYVQECVATNWVSSAGPFVDRFERELAACVGARRAVATCNGTAALHVALLVAGVQPEDEVLVSDLTFIAPANAVRYCGAWPVFVDAEPEYWQMDVGKAAELLVNGYRFDGRRLISKTTHRRLSAILPVHILGHPVDMDPLMKLARQFGLAVIEDATESLGAKYKGGMVGHLGDIACFSFNGNKIVTAGGGGMIVTDNEAWARKARYLTTQAKDDPVEYVHKEIGYNYRLTNLQAAMGCAQIEALDEHIRKKRRIAAFYRDGLAGIEGVELMKESPDASSIWWMPTVLVDAERYGMGSRELLKLLEHEGVQSRPLWQPMHLSPAHPGRAPLPCPVAKDLHRRGLSLPCSVGLTEDQQARVVGIIRGAAGRSLS